MTRKDNSLWSLDLSSSSSLKKTVNSRRTRLLKDCLPSELLPHEHDSQSHHVSVGNEPGYSNLTVALASSSILCFLVLVYYRKRRRRSSCRSLKRAEVWRDRVSRLGMSICCCHRITAAGRIKFLSNSISTDLQPEMIMICWWFITSREVDITFGWVVQLLGSMTRFIVL